MRHAVDRFLVGLLYVLAVAIVSAVLANLQWRGYLVLGAVLVVVSIAGLCIVLLKRKELRRLNRWIDDRCQGCGYNLRGLGGSGRCPECGKVFKGLGLDGCGVRA
jgi:hypothetical protein